MAAPQGLQGQVHSLCLTLSIVASVSSLFPTSQSGQESTLHPPVSAHILADRFQVCLPHSFEPLLKAHALLWALPWGFRALWGWCSSRCFGEDTGEKRHYRSRRIQEDPGQGMEPVSLDTAWFSLLLITRFFWRFPDSLHSFLLLSIQQRFIEHLICTRHFQTWHLRRSNGNHCNHVMKTCLPSVIGKYVPNTQLQRGQEMSVSIGSPLTAHPITRYSLPSQVAAVFSVSTICSVLILKIRHSNGSFSLFIISLL